MRDDPALADMALLRLSRLSVSPVTPAQWKHILRLGGWSARRLSATRS